MSAVNAAGTSNTSNVTQVRVVNLPPRPEITRISAYYLFLIYMVVRFIFDTLNVSFTMGNTTASATIAWAGNTTAGGYPLFNLRKKLNLDYF